MGVRDRDWYKDAQKARDGAQTTLDTASASGGLSKGLKWGPLAIVIFWLVVMAIVYAGMRYVMQPKQITISASGDMKIPRARDGHFYAPGLVGGKPVVFLVDTGASYVTVSPSFASYAGLGAGRPIRFQTANGTVDGRIVPDVAVSVGSTTVSGVRVGVGLVGGERDNDLLGQSFLSKFRITLTRDEMILSGL